MSFFSRVGHFITGSQESLQGGEDEDVLTELEQSYLEETCNTMLTASHIEDRRVGAKSLHAFTKLHPQAVGVYGLQTVIQALDRDWEDEETAEEFLEILTAICTTRSPAKGNRNAREFAEIFLKDESNLALLMRILSSGDGGPQMKFGLLSLLGGMGELCGNRVREGMVRIPNAISDVVGILSERAEYLQTETLGLLIGLAETSFEVQKMVAFEGGLDKLVQMAIDAGGLEVGGSVTEEALHLLFILLNDNPSNQKLFCENGLLLKLQQLLLSDDCDERAAIHLMRLVACLIDRSVSKGAPSIQELFVNTPGLIDPIIRLSLNSSDAIATEALITLSLTCRFNEKTQESVSSMKFEKEPLISCLIRGALDEETSLDRRAAAIRAFNELIRDNNRIKMAIVSTFTPPPTEEDEPAQSAGSLIISALTTNFTFTVCHLLSALLIGSLDCKQVALGHLVVEEEEGTMNLFQSLIFTLLSCSKVNCDSLVSILGLFSVWIFEFPPACQQFLDSGSTTHFLLELIEQHHEQALILQGVSAFLLSICIVVSESNDLRNLIHNRIGAEIFGGKIQNLVDHLNDYRLDPSFKELFQRTARDVLEKSLTPIGQPLNPQLEAMKTYYEGILAERDSQIHSLQQSLIAFEQTMADWRELRLKASQLESALLYKEQELAFARRANSSSSGSEELLAENERLRMQADAYVSQMLAVEAENEELLRQLSIYESFGNVEPIQLKPIEPTHHHVETPTSSEEQHHTPVKSVTEFASGAFSKLQHSALVTKLTSSNMAPSPSSTTTFDV